MAFQKDFGNTVSVEKSKKQEITTLTELEENSKDTIFNLLFGEVENKES